MKGMKFSKKARMAQRTAKSMPKIRSQAQMPSAVAILVMVLITI